MKNMYIPLEDGFIDLDFDIVDFKKYKNTVDEEFYKVEIASLYENSICSIVIDIIDDGVDTFTGYGEDGKTTELKFSAGRLCISSIGEKSDYFLKALSKLYSSKIETQKMKEIIYSVAIALEGNIANMETEILKLKCFFNDGSYENDDENLYAEIFININLKNKIVQIAEKDMDYRENIIKTFSDL